jgi:hypothetical protein
MMRMSGLVGGRALRLIWLTVTLRMGLELGVASPHQLVLDGEYAAEVFSSVCTE